MREGPVVTTPSLPRLAARACAALALSAALAGPAAAGEPATLRLEGSAPSYGSLVGVPLLGGGSSLLVPGRNEYTLARAGGTARTTGFAIDPLSVLPLGVDYPVDLQTAFDDPAMWTGPYREAGWLLYRSDDLIDAAGDPGLEAGALHLAILQLTGQSPLDLGAIGHPDLEARTDALRDLAAGRRLPTEVALDAGGPDACPGQDLTVRVTGSPGALVDLSRPARRRQRLAVAGEPGRRRGGGGAGARRRRRNPHGDRRDEHAAAPARHTAARVDRAPEPAAAAAGPPERAGGAARGAVPARALRPPGGGRAGRRPQEADDVAVAQDLPAGLPEAGDAGRRPRHGEGRRGPGLAHHGSPTAATGRPGTCGSPSAWAPAWRRSAPRAPGGRPGPRAGTPSAGCSRRFPPAPRPSSRLRARVSPRASGMRSTTTTLRAGGLARVRSAGTIAVRPARGAAE